MNYCSKPLTNYRQISREEEVLPRLFTPSKVPLVQRWVLSGPQQEEKLAFLRTMLRKNEEREATKQVLSSSFHPEVVPKVQRWLNRAPEEERSAITRMFRSIASDPMVQQDAPTAWGEEEQSGPVTMDTDRKGTQVMQLTPLAPANAKPLTINDHFVFDKTPPKTLNRKMNGDSQRRDTLQQPRQIVEGKLVPRDHALAKAPDQKMNGHFQPSYTFPQPSQKILADHRKMNGHWLQHSGAFTAPSQRTAADHVIHDHALPKLERPASTRHNCKKVQWRQDEPRPATASGPYVAGMRTEFDIFPDWRAPHRLVVPMTQVPYRVRALRQIPVTTKHECSTFRRRDFVIHPEWVTH